MCTVDGQYRCTGPACGDTAAGQRFDGVCDKDGCDMNAFRGGATSFFGPGGAAPAGACALAVGVNNMGTIMGPPTIEPDPTACCAVCNATAGCAPLAGWLAARGCARDGSDCVLRVEVVDDAGAVVLETAVALAAPGAVALPPGAAAAVSVAVAPAANADGSVNVTVSSAASAMWVHLTTAAAGRFSDSAFHLWGAGERVVAFIPWEPGAADALGDTLRVEHLRSYY